MAPVDAGMPPVQVETVTPLVSTQFDPMTPTMMPANMAPVAAAVPTVQVETVTAPVTTQSDPMAPAMMPAKMAPVAAAMPTVQDETKTATARVMAPASMKALVGMPLPSFMSETTQSTTMAPSTLSVTTAPVAAVMPTFQVQSETGTARVFAPASMEALVAMPPASLLSETTQSETMASANLPATMAPVMKQSWMPHPKFPVVTSNDDPFFHKEMRDINAFDFSVESCRTVRICKNNAKHIFCDFLKELGNYENITDAHDDMMLLMQAKDPRIIDLESLEVNDKVLPNGKPVILLSCPDSIELLKRLRVTTVVGRTRVISQNASMYGKKLRDVHLAGFMVESDATIHFCSRDHTVRVADLMVGLGKFASYKYANRALLQWYKTNDEPVKGLRSLVVDHTKSEMVCSFFLCMCVCVYPIHARH